MLPLNLSVFCHRPSFLLCAYTDHDRCPVWALNPIPHRPLSTATILATSSRIYDVRDCILIVGTLARLRRIGAGTYRRSRSTRSQATAREASSRATTGPASIPQAPCTALCVRLHVCSVRVNNGPSPGDPEDLPVSTLRLKLRAAIAENNECVQEERLNTMNEHTFV